MKSVFASGCMEFRCRVRAWLKKPIALQLQSVANWSARLLERVEDVIFEKCHGLRCRGFIETSELATSYHLALPHSQAYEAVSCAAIRELIRETKKTKIVFDNFIDLGSGKGKACFYAATKAQFKKVIGVEFSATLVEVANANARRFAGKVSTHNICFINSDAAVFALPPGNSLIFLFNPFNNTVLKKFLQNNVDHFRQNQSVIAYANDKQRLCLAANGFVTLFRNQDSHGSLHQYGLYGYDNCRNS